MVHIVGVELADPFKLVLEFNTGERKLVNIEQYLRGPIFQSGGVEQRRSHHRGMDRDRPIAGSLDT
jgi:hypothetical protein